MSSNRRAVHHIALVVAAIFLSALPALGQDRPAPALDLAAGWVGFGDDGVVSELPVGAAFRWYLSPRISIGPEVTFISGESHAHQVLTGNLTFNFRAPRGGLPVVTPFIVVGGGLFRTSEDFAGRPAFSSTEGAFTVGGGLRARLSDRADAAIDLRLGWEPHRRVTGVISLRLGAGDYDRLASEGKIWSFNWSGHSLSVSHFVLFRVVRVFRE